MLREGLPAAPLPFLLGQSFQIDKSRCADLLWYRYKALYSVDSNIIQLSVATDPSIEYIKDNIVKD